MGKIMMVIPWKLEIGEAQKIKSKIEDYYGEQEY